MSRWFRFYDDALEDPKVQRLDPMLFKAWVNILCIASKRNGVMPPLCDIAFALRMPDQQADAVVQSLINVGLLEDVGGKLMPHGWHERQYVDRTNSERQQRYREKHKTPKPVTVSNAVTTVTRNAKVTVLETDTDTDKKNIKKSRSSSLAELDSQFEIFWDYCPRKIGKLAAKKSFEKAMRLTDFDTIMEGIDAYAKSRRGQDESFTVHPATWLNQGRWEDKATVKRGPPSQEDMNRRAEEFIARKKLEDQLNGKHL